MTVRPVAAISLSTCMTLRAILESRPEVLSVSHIRRITSDEQYSRFVNQQYSRIIDHCLSALILALSLGWAQHMPLASYPGFPSACSSLPAPLASSPCLL